MTEEVAIERRFRGPPDSANGGYTCGIVAGAFAPNGPAEVALRLPPPLDRPLALERRDGGAELRDGDALVASGSPLESLDLELPDPISLDVAEAAQRRSPLFDHHPFSECFVCGPDRDEEDGLRVILGPVESLGLVASPFVVDSSLPNDDGILRPEVGWAALDCPSGNAMMLAPGTGTSVLGTLAARLLAPLQTGRTYVAAGWPVGRDGRKFDSGSAIFDEAGEVLAFARARWIELRLES